MRAIKGAIWAEKCPADAHDAPLLPRRMRAITGAVGFGLGGPSVLMMLPWAVDSVTTLRKSS